MFIVSRKGWGGGEAFYARMWHLGHYKEPMEGIQ